MSIDCADSCEGAPRSRRGQRSRRCSCAAFALRASALCLVFAALWGCTGDDDGGQDGASGSSSGGAGGSSSGGAGGSSSGGAGGASSGGRAGSTPGGTGGSSSGGTGGSTSGGRGGSSTGGGGGDAADTGASTCAALGDTCMDDHAGKQEPSTQACCEGAFCGMPQCDNAIPPRCRASCACSSDGQTCREEINGKVTTERPCCEGFACTGCVDADPESRLCVCRPR